MELFFDLVCVFAFTQLSDTLFGHQSARGTIETLVLFLAVWWAWNYTAWATNWIDPDRMPVAVLMLVLMAISLVVSVAIPHAFGGRGVPFAFAYVSLQVLRAAFMVWALRGQRMGRNYTQVLSWSAIAGAFWIAGARGHRAGAADDRRDVRVAAGARRLLDRGAALVGCAGGARAATPTLVLATSSRRLRWASDAAAMKLLTRTLAGLGAVAAGALIAAGVYAEATRAPDQP
jgi:hypothetical protein